MLIMGFVLKNVPGFDFAKDIDPLWSADIRLVVLKIIMIRAGLRLDGKVKD